MLQLEGEEVVQLEGEGWLQAEGEGEDWVQGEAEPAVSPSIWRSCQGPLSWPPSTDSCLGGGGEGDEREWRGLNFL